MSAHETGLVTDTTPSQRVSPHVDEPPGVAAALPPRWPTPAELRDFLRDNCTIVRPGETLVIQSADLTPNQAREVMDWLNYVRDDGTPLFPFRTIVVPGDGLGTVSDEVVQDSLRGLVHDEVDARLASVTRERRLNSAPGGTP